MIGQRIREAREALGFSQEQLADSLGISFQSVQQWETGKTTPRATRMRKLATVLGKSPTWIQFGVGPSDSTKIDDVYKLITSAEFKSQVSGAYSKSLQTCISLNWLALKRSDMTLGILADLFYSKLLEEYGIDPRLVIDDELDSAEIVDKMKK